MERAKRKSSCLLTDQGMAWKLLAGIRLSSLHPNVTSEDFYEEPQSPSKMEREEAEAYTVSKAMVCSLCEAKFDTRHQQKAHYRLDWHRFNLKRRMMGLKSVTEETFADLADDVSSISGSGDSSSSSDEDNTDMSPNSPDKHLLGNHGQQASPGRRKKVPSIHKYESEDDTDDDGQTKSDGNGRRHPRIYFENDEGDVVSIYRCIVHGKREAPTSHSELISSALKLLMNQKWAIMLTGGGHFAAAVYDGSEVIAHKTFHRYTVRAKRGTVQSVRDSQGNAPKSAGASIRRHNEAALNQEVQELLASWKSHLDACTRIFLRMPGYNRTMFYGGKNPALAKTDPRVVTIPFATRRATYKELKRVWEILASVECHGSIAEVESLVSSPKEKTDCKKGRKPPRDKEVLDKNEDVVLDSILDRLEKQSLQDEANEKEREANNDGDKKEEPNKMEDNEKDEEENVRLTTEEVVRTFDHLKQYEVVINKKPRKKKKKQDTNIPKKDGEEEALTNELYTLCRTGGLDKLEQVLKKIQQKYSRLAPVPVALQDPKSGMNEPDPETESTNSEQSVKNNSPPWTDLSNNLLPNDVNQSAPHLGSTGSGLASADGLQTTGDDARVLQQTAGAINSTINESVEGQSGDSVTIVPASDNSHEVANLPSSERTDATGAAANEECLAPEDAVKDDDAREQNSTNMYSNKSGTQNSNEPKNTTDDNEEESITQNSPSSENQTNGNPTDGNTSTCIGESGTDDVNGARPGKEFFKFLNKSLDDFGYTFLHVAAEDGQQSVLYRLMECGADPGVKNKKGKPPFGCSLDKKTKDEFKRFRINYPERYDFERAQIPAPLTDEQEKEKAAKQAEKKRNARKAKRAREKDQKEVKEEQRKEEEKKKKEEEKKNWYSSLSDREKRGLAAEKRFAQQTASTTDLQRCWGCGSSLAGKVPFTYMDFRFCSMPCLKQHKQKQQK